MLFSLKEFSYGCERGDALSQEVPAGSASLRFYMNALYQYCANYFLVGGSRKLRDVLKDLGSGDLLAPIDTVLETALGTTTFGDILKAFRDKFLVHQSFTFAPIEEAVHRRFDILAPGNAERFQRLVNDLYARTQELYLQLGLRYPEAFDAPDSPAVGTRSGSREEVTVALRMRGEVHFHQQNEGSVYIETDATGSNQEFMELLFICCLALRQMVNLKGHPASTSLASILTQMGGNTDELARHQSPDGPRLVGYPGTPGRKRFDGVLRYEAGNLGFSLNAKGLGLFARGVGYYAPNSVLLVLRHLATKHVADGKFLAALADAMVNCGHAFLGRQVTLRNQNSVALVITEAALKS